MNPAMVNINLTSNSTSNKNKRRENNIGKFRTTSMVSIGYDGASSENRLDLQNTMIPTTACISNDKISRRMLESGKAKRTSAEAIKRAI